MMAVLLSQPVATDGGVELPEEPERRRQTVVTSSRTERRLEEAVVSTEVITRPQIEALGARDLAQLLQQHPGVELVYTNRAVGLRLQGLDPEYSLILVDGQRVAGRAGAVTDLMRFSLRDVDRVEIVKGPAAALYGADAMGGVVNLITRRPQRPLEASLRGTFGTLLEGDVRGHVGSKLGPFELRAGGSYRTRNAFDWDPQDADTSGPALKRQDGDLELAWQPDEGLRTWVRTGYVRMDLEGVDISDTGAVFDRRQRTEQFDVWFGGRAAAGTDVTVTARGHYGLFRDQFQLDQRGSRALDEYSQNFTRLGEGLAQVDWKLGAHSVTGGLEGLTERLNSSRLSPSRVGRGRLGAFIQDEWKVDWAGPKLEVAPGFRFDLDSQFGGAPSPRLAVKLDPSPALTVRASWGLGFRPPNFSELYFQFANTGIGYIVVGNPHLTAERSGSFHLGVDWRPQEDGWVVSAGAWHTRLTNLINVTASAPPDPDNPTRFTYENVAKAYTQGIEVGSRVKLVRGMYLDLGYTLLDAKDRTRDRPLEGRAKHRVTLGLTGKYRPANLELALRGSWVSKRPYYLGLGGGAASNVLGFESQVVEAPGYVDLEAQLGYTVWSWLKVFVNGYNLLNAGDPQFNPRPPRGVMGGVQLDY
jgi:outer membrane receptor for ferrienterochelin and colicins